MTTYQFTVTIVIITKENVIIYAPQKSSTRHILLLGRRDILIGATGEDADGPVLPVSQLHALQPDVVTCAQFSGFTLPGGVSAPDRNLSIFSPFSRQRTVKTTHSQSFHQRRASLGDLGPETPKPSSSFSRCASTPRLPKRH